MEGCGVESVLVELRGGGLREAVGIASETFVAAVVGVVDRRAGGGVGLNVHPCVRVVVVAVLLTVEDVVGG